MLGPSMHKLVSSSIAFVYAGTQTRWAAFDSFPRLSLDKYFTCHKAEHAGLAAAREKNFGILKQKEMEGKGRLFKFKKVLMLLFHPEMYMLQFA